MASNNYNVVFLLLLVAKREEEQYKDHKERVRETTTQMLCQQRPAVVGKSLLSQSRCVSGCSSSIPHSA